MLGVRAKPGRKARLFRRLPQVIRLLGAIQSVGEEENVGGNSPDLGTKFAKKAPTACLNDSGTP